MLFNLIKIINRNGMPKPAEFDMAAKSIVAHFPIAKDASSTADNIIHSSWYDVNTNVGRLSNYVRDRRSNNKNKGAIVRSYNKRYVFQNNIFDSARIHFLIFFMFFCMQTN